MIVGAGFAAFALLVAVPAVAGTVRQEASTREARVTLALFSKCLVNRAGAKFRKLFDVPVEGEGQKQWEKLLNPSCLTASVSEPGLAELRFSTRLVRGGVFEAFYHKDFGKAAPVAGFEDVGPVAYPGQDWRGQAAHAAGDCIVRAAPLDARALVMSRVAGDDEAAAVARLGPVTDSCLRQSPLFDLGIANLRGAVAESLYRLTRAKVPA